MTRAVEVRRLQQLQRELVRHRQQHSRTDFALLLVGPLRVAHQHPGPLRINRTANPEAELADRRAPAARS